MRRLKLCLVIAALVAAPLSAAQSPMPQPAASAPALPPPRDRPYHGVIQLRVDASNSAQRIVRVHESIPVAAGKELILLYPEWLPGSHAPKGRARISRFAGLEISAGKQRLAWARDALNVYAFHVQVPEAISQLEVDFEYLAPPSGDYGTVDFSGEILTLDWACVVLYPAGYFARQIQIAPQITLPMGWHLATALDTVTPATGDGAHFAPTSLETLVDSPLYAGRNFAQLDLVPGDPVPVRMDLFADQPEQLQVTAAQLDAHRAVVQQAYRLFGSGHYAHYDFLVTLSDVFPIAGTEHHQSSFDGLKASYFSDWNKLPAQRDVLPHEFVHSWNGKFRRPADLWTANYEVPMRNSLLWVYEGQTQYWGDVLAARSGLWSREQALDVLAMTVATYQAAPGSEWRSVEDTTQQPIIQYQGSQAWPSWQRGTDYYRVGELIWMDADTLIREKSGGQHSLDDFARQFFGMHSGSVGEITYTFADVVAALNRIEPYDWAGFLHERLEEVGAGAPLDGVGRGGYRLVFSDTASDAFKQSEVEDKVTNLNYSIGLSVDKDGKVKTVLWNGPAFKAGLAPTDQILAVDGFAFDPDRLKNDIKAAAGSSAALEFIVRQGDQFRTIHLDYHAGLRYPHLVRDPSRAALLDAILSPRAP